MEDAVASKTFAYCLSCTGRCARVSIACSVVCDAYRLSHTRRSDHVSSACSAVC